MVKLLIIADDFTGAIDTGVQFAASGVETRVITNLEYDFQKASEQSVQVLVLDAETRHLQPEQAYRLIYSLTKRASKSGIPFLYKKTDSALRGNVGSELKAVLDATHQPSLHFLPSFPKMNRIVKNGTLYIDGIPVQESVFGKDPFEPVTCSFIPDLIGKEIPVTVIESLQEWNNPSGILVYDAQTEKDLAETGKFLMEKEALHIMAGCAGFAAVLPHLLGLTGSEKKEIPFKKHFLIACGSVNPITKKQVDYAETEGFSRIRLTPKQKLDTGYYETEEGRNCLLSWQEICRQNQPCILDTNDLSGKTDTLDYAQKHHISMEELRVRISSTLGYVVKELVLSGIESTILITGGDCLTGFMKHIQCEEITPVCEIATGTVLSEIKVAEQSFGIISKSGGFGQEALLVDLAKIILRKEEKKHVKAVYA